MKGFRNALRVMIVAGSVTGFFSGWVMLAHTVVSKSATTTQSVASAPAVGALPPLDLKALAPQGDVQAVSASNNLQTNPQTTVGIQPLQVMPQQTTQGFAPRLRTSGS